MGELAHHSNSLLYLVVSTLLLPFSSFLLLILLGRTIKKFRGIYATVILFSCFTLSLFIGKEVFTNGAFYYQIPWFQLSAEKIFFVGIKVDYLSGLLLVIVNFVSFLVHLFSIAYLRGDRDFEKYFAYLGLFTFSMTGILISNNLLMLFVFWELVGLSSYLLIGYWYDKPSAVEANKKAFLVNKIGDSAFLVAILALYSFAGTLDFNELMAWFPSQSVLSTTWLMIIGLSLFVGCVTKSAQFPLQIWLPDAMEGPTPVSALIHAATMVAAGIFLLARIFFLLSDDVLTIVATIGAITAFMGAVAACTQNDIKKVLAFSTISQLGY
ncbi:MAG: NADH-quinone oxidoreductase subunit L, partial [Cyclobacteriaceae bacterium]